MYKVISIAAVIAYFIPLILVLVKKAWNDAFFRLFAIYWGVGGVINLLDIIPGVSSDVIHHVGLFYNILDIPFILGILHYTSSYTFVKKTVSGAIAIFAILQVISLIISGLTYDSLTLPLGFGVAMVLLVVTMEIIRYMQKVEHNNRQNAKMFVYGALVFEYASFIVIYIFDYIIETENRKDSFIIYYVSSVVAMLIASCGYLMYSMRKERRAIME
jgi:hypothetical protein